MDANKNSPKDDRAATKKVMRIMMMAATALILLLAVGLWGMSQYMNQSSLPSELQYSKNSPNQPALTIPQYIWPDTKPTLVSFWAAWCEPCLRELPQLNRLAKETPGLQILVLNIDNKNSAYFETAQNILAELGPFNFKHQFVSESVFQAFDAEALPANFLVSAQKKIIWQHFGELNWLSEDVKLTLSKFIKESLKDQ